MLVESEVSVRSCFCLKCFAKASIQIGSDLMMICLGEQDPNSFHLQNDRRYEGENRELRNGLINDHIKQNI
jgi:hypothetical protein